MARAVPGQAIAAGLSADQVERSAAVAGWQRLTRGLYALPGSAPSWERDATAACLLAGDDAVASHLTAAALWRWVRPPVLPRVTVPHGRSTRTRLARVHRSPVPGVDRATRDGIRCTSASRTLLDCAGVVERGRLEQFVDDALCARVATVGSVRAAVERAGRRGRRGVATLDAVLEVWSEDIRPDSPAEVRLLRRLAALGWPAWSPSIRSTTRAAASSPAWTRPCPSGAWASSTTRTAGTTPGGSGVTRPATPGWRRWGWRVEAVCKHDLLPSSTRLAELLDGPAGASSAA